MTSFTIRDLPAKLHRKLKASAKRNRRSLNAEMVERLEMSIGPQRVGAEELLERARRFREMLHFRTSNEEVTRLKRAGRP